MRSSVDLPLTTLPGSKNPAVFGQRLVCPTLRFGGIRRWRQNRFRCRRSIAEREVRPDGIVVAPPVRDQHLRFPHRREDFAAQELVAELRLQCGVRGVSQGAPRRGSSTTWPSKQRARCYAKCVPISRMNRQQAGDRSRLLRCEVTLRMVLARRRRFTE